MWKIDKYIVMNINLKFSNAIIHIKSKIVVVIKSNRFVAIVIHISILLYSNANNILIIGKMGI
jgi:hypothetical protein